MLRVGSRIATFSGLEWGFGLRTISLHEPRAGVSGYQTSLAQQRLLKVPESRTQTRPSFRLGNEILDLWTQLSNHGLEGL